LSPAALFHFGTEGQADMPERPGARTASGMKQRTVQTLYGYWNALRAGRIAPRRLEIEPSRIGSILSETFMLERTDPATCRYRLAGTRLCEIFGFELLDPFPARGRGQPDPLPDLRHRKRGVILQGGEDFLVDGVHGESGLK
jgi:hypothetical protein